MSKPNYKQIVASSKYNYKDFSRHIAKYLGIKWSEDFYQKQYQRLIGDVKPSEKEKEAWDWWVETLRNPFDSSVVSFRAKDIKGKLNIIERWLSSGIYNSATARKTIREIKDILN